MNAQPELSFYPDAPGYKKRGTSKAAADSMRVKAPTLRDKVLGLLCFYNLTADECAQKLGVTELACRPRLSELVRLGKIVDTGTTRRNSSGKMATVWRV